MNRQKALLLILLIPLQTLLKAQAVVDTLPQLLLALDDTITIYQNNHLLNRSSISHIQDGSGDIQIDLDKEKGQWAYTYYLCTRGDTFSVQPLTEKAMYLSATNGFDTIQVLLNFYNSIPSFPDKYQNLHRQQVQFAIPPVYELVHIALSITESGMSASDLLNFQTFYAEEVNRHFKQYSEHALIQNLNHLISHSSFDQVFENLTRYSLPLTFQEKRIIHDGVYPMPYRINPWTGPLLEQLQGFADQSRFLDFLEKHKGYHEKLLHEQQQFVQLDSLWMWLEEQFPGQIDGYKMLFSPLAGQTMGHQVFASDEYKENVLFLDNPESFLQQPGANTFKEARLLKMVFDEIVPFYQKQLIQSNKDLIRNTFSNPSYWMTNGLKAFPEEVFERYMNNAVFCLWAEEKYPSLQARMIRQEIEEEMLHKGYIRFYAFSRQLTGLFRQYEGQKPIADLYRELLQEY